MIAIRARARVRRDDGLTLAELLVTMSLSIVVLVLISAFFIQMARAATTANATRDSTATVSNLANELSDVIRPASTIVVAGSTKPAPAVVSAMPNELIVYSYSDSKGTDVRPIMVRFALNSRSQMVESRWNATKNNTTGLWNFPAITTTAASTRTFPGTIVAPSAAGAGETTANAPMFTFLDAKSQVIALTSGEVASTKLGDIAAIRFTLRVKASSARDAKTGVIQNVVGMPNIGLQAKDDK